MKKILIFLNQILLTILLTIFLLTVIFFTTIGNKNYLLNQLEKNNYYDQIYHHSLSTIEGYTIQLGLNKDTIETLYTKEKVKKDIHILINGMYANQKMNIDTTEITQKLDQIINDQLKQNNRIPSPTEQQSIKTFKNQISTIYQDEILYEKKYIPKLQKIFSRILSLKKKVLIFLSILNLSFIITLLLLNKKTHTQFQSLSNSILSSALLLMMIKFLFQEKFQRIVILSNIFSRLLITILNHLFQIMFLTGIIMSIISIIGIILEIKHTKEH